MKHKPNTQMKTETITNPHAAFKPEHLEGLAKDLDRYTNANPGCSYFTKNDGERVRWMLKGRAQLMEALEVFAKVADEYDKNCLDECRPEWNGANDDATELLTGRGGKPLLALRHFKQARRALEAAQ